MISSMNGNATGMDASASNISMVSSGDSTATVAHWGFSPILKTILLPCVVLLNVTVIVLFVIKRPLHHPFNIYLGNLLIANLCFEVLSTPFEIIKSVHRSWWLGSVACTAHLYGNWVAGAVTVYAHLLITVNRIWAVTFPHSYRRNSTKKMSLVMCSSAGVFVHCLCLPGVILDAMYYRRPEAKGCSLNLDALVDYYLAYQIVISLLPNFIIIAAYPYLWWMSGRRRFRSAVRPTRKDNANTTEHRQSTQHTQGITSSNVVAVPKQGSFGARHTDKESHRAFSVLTLLTISITVCWTPCNILFTLGSSGFMEIDYQSALFHVSLILFMLQPALDPLLFAAALPDLRKAVFKLFSRAG